MSDQTLLPPSEQDDSALLAIRELLAGDGPVRLHADDHGPSAGLPLPEAVRIAMQQVLEAMAAHRGVTVCSADTMLTSQQAADLLGVSRPTLIRILDAGQLAYSTPGRHRRLRLEDVLSYRRRVAAMRRHELDAIAREHTAEQGSAEANAFITTR